MQELLRYPDVRRSADRRNKFWASSRSDAAHVCPIHRPDSSARAFDHARCDYEGIGPSQKIDRDGAQGDRSIRTLPPARFFQPLLTRSKNAKGEGEQLVASEE